MENHIKSNVISFPLSEIMIFSTKVKRWFA